MPLGAPQPATLSGVNRFPGGQVHFTINGQPDWRYQVQATTNFLDWQTLETLLATNSLVDFLDTNAGGFDRRFFRTVTLP